jgi:hypothetical protein
MIHVYVGELGRYVPTIYAVLVHVHRGNEGRKEGTIGWVEEGGE